MTVCVWILPTLAVSKKMNSVQQTSQGVYVAGLFNFSPRELERMAGLKSLDDLDIEWLPMRQVHEYVPIAQETARRLWAYKPPKCITVERRDGKLYARVEDLRIYMARRKLLTEEHAALGFGPWVRISTLPQERENWVGRRATGKYAAIQGMLCTTQDIARVMGVKRNSLSHKHYREILPRPLLWRHGGAKASNLWPREVLEFAQFARESLSKSSRARKILEKAAKQIEQSYEHLCVDDLILAQMRKSGSPKTSSPL